MRSGCWSASPGNAASRIATPSAAAGRNLPIHPSMRARFSGEMSPLPPEGMLWITIAAPTSSLPCAVRVQLVTTPAAASTSATRIPDAIASARLNPGSSRLWPHTAYYGRDAWSDDRRAGADRAGDGTVTVASQTLPEAQAQAKTQRAIDAGHEDILENEQTLARVEELLRARFH